MECPQIEARAQARCRLLPEPLDLALTDLVGQGLGRPADVAVGLDHGVGLRQARVQQLRNRAFARPAEGVDPGVDYQARGPMGLPVEHAKSFGRIEVEPHLVRQAFRVQAPALDVGHAGHSGAHAAEGAQVRHLGLERDLEMMPGNGLVEAGAGQAQVAPARQVVRVDVVDPGAAAVDRGRVVEGGRRVGFLERLDRSDLDGRPWAGGRSTPAIGPGPARSGRGRGSAARRPSSESLRGSSRCWRERPSCRRPDRASG